MQVGSIFTRLKLDNKEFNQKLSQSKTALKQTGREMAQSLKRGAKAFEELTRSSKTFSNASSNVSNRVKNLRSGFDNLKFQFRSVGSSADFLGGKLVGGLGAGLKMLPGLLLNVTQLVAGLGVGLVALAGVGLFQAIKTAGDFQTEMLKVKAISRATEEQFASLSQQAKDLGRTTQFSAKQVAEAQKYQAMAGLKVNEILIATPGILNLAAAANLDLGRSADIATNIMSQFGLEAKDLSGVVDVLALTVNTSNQYMEQLADAMNYLGPTAKAMGVSLADAAAVTGIMASNGLQGSLGTRALGTSLTRLSKPTKAMRKSMAMLNLDFFDAKGNFVGLAGTVKQLEKGMAGLTQEQRQYHLSSLFGAEAIQEWNILMATGSDKVAKYSSELANAGGTAGKMAETMMGGYQGAILRFQSAWEGLMISIGESGALDLVTMALTEMANVLTGMAGHVETHVKPKMMEFFHSLQDWYNNGGKEAVITFMRDAWALLQQGFRVFTEVIWPVLRDALKGIFNYLGSEKGRKDIALMTIQVNQMVDGFNKLVGSITSAKNELANFDNQAKQKRRGNIFGSGAVSHLLGLDAPNRESGGPVSAGKLYEVGEQNKAEMLMMGGKQYMIPGNNGQVLNQDQMGSGKVININITGQMIDQKALDDFTRRIIPILKQKGI